MMLVVVLLFVFLCSERQMTYAGVYDNAYDFYQTYGNRMIFVPTSNTDGYIYYATRGKKNTTSPVLYSTVGWKATVLNLQGGVVQEIYYQLGGNYMTVHNSKNVNGYDYMLYRVSLSSFKARLNAGAKTALTGGKCEITFDACIIMKRLGAVSGGMTDAGISWGSVYTSYQGIIDAEEWSTETQESLRSYFNKEVEGLFLTLSLGKDSGIATVSGAGKYCYGTTATISATTKNGYMFSKWSGTTSYTKQTQAIVMNRNITLTAYSIRGETIVTYHRNHSSEDTVTKQQKLVYGLAGQSFTNCGWSKTGYYQAGWNHKSTDIVPLYGISADIKATWISKYMPKVSLYAIWIPNSYQLVFDANGAEDISAQMQEIVTNYDAQVILPECAYENKKASFLGWSLKADGMMPQYVPGETVAMKEIAALAGVENVCNAKIVLYAIWDEMPAINVPNIYVSLENAKKGMITEEFLAGFARASDVEDGNIPFGTNERNSFLLTDYNATSYTQMKKEGVVTETFCVRDSHGNTCYKTTHVYVVDVSRHSIGDVKGEVRFISQKYYLDENGDLLSEEYGGLKKNSIWRLNENYRELLDILFGPKDDD